VSRKPIIFFKRRFTVMKKDAKVIFSPQLANYLLSKKYTIIKLKPKHDSPNETVYVFRLDDGLYECIEEWMKNGNHQLS
jgi:hypothetical protein